MDVALHELVIPKPGRAGTVAGAGVAAKAVATCGAVAVAALCAPSGIGDLTHPPTHRVQRPARTASVRPRRSESPPRRRHHTAPPSTRPAPQPTVAPTVAPQPPTTPPAVAAPAATTAPGAAPSAGASEFGFESG